MTTTQTFEWIDRLMEAAKIDGASHVRDEIHLFELAFLDELEAEAQALANK